MLKLTQFQAARRRQLAARTVEIYSRHLSYLDEYLEREQVDPADFGPDAFYLYLDTDHPDWSRSTAAGALAAFKSYAAWAGHKDHPIKTAKIKRRRSSVQRTLSADELRQLFDSLDSGKTGIRDRALIQLAVHTGMRAAELCRLRLADVDLETLKLHVVQKGGEVRWAVIPPFIVPDLERWLKVRRKVAEPTCLTFFTSVGGIKPGTHLTPDGLKAVCRYLAVNAGLEHFSPHALRRTFATLYAAQGVNLKVIASQGGWTDVAMPAYYARALQPDAMRGVFHDFAE